MKFSLVVLLAAHFNVCAVFASPALPISPPASVSEGPTLSLSVPPSKPTGSVLASPLFIHPTPIIAPVPTTFTPKPTVTPSLPTAITSVPPVASALVSSAIAAAATQSIGSAIPTALPIPSLGLDEGTLIRKLSQALQVLELIIGLLQTLAKTGEVDIPGIGPVGIAVEGVLIGSLLKLATELVPTPST